MCGLPIISPYNYYYHKWAFIILLLDLSYAAFVVPIGMCLLSRCKPETRCLPQHHVAEMFCAFMQACLLDA